MILFKNRLIFGLVKKIIVGFFSVIYKVLSLFNLQFTLLVALVGVVLYFTGTLSNGGVVPIIFYIALIASIIYAIVASIRKLLGLGKKVKRSKGVQIVEGDNKNQDGTGIGTCNVSAQPLSSGQTVEPQEVIVQQVDKPRYYRVKQNPEYIMAEYSDRVELFKISGSKLIKVRTDYK